MIFTEAAADKIKILIGETTADKVPVGLRIAVTGGGCSGLQYVFKFETEINDDDFIVETKGVKLLIDAISKGYMEEATIDYIVEDFNEQFIVKNPNSTTTCGCGNSFSQ